MDLTDESWGAVRNTPGVTGFVGHAHQPTPLTPRRGRQDPRPRSRGEDRRSEAAAEVEVRRLRGRRLGHRHRRPVRHPAGHDQRDQPRHASAQGPRRDLRPGDPGRAVVQPDPEELARTNVAGRRRLPYGTPTTARTRSMPPRRSSRRSSSSRSTPARPTPRRRSARRSASTASTSWSSARRTTPRPRPSAARSSPSRSRSTRTARSPSSPRRRRPPG